MFLGCENEVVVLVAQRLEGGPVDSRVGAFPEVLSVANRGNSLLTYFLTYDAAKNMSVICCG